MQSGEEQHGATSESGEDKPAPAAPSVAGGFGSRSRAYRRFRGWRGWLLRFALLVASPALFFGVAELTLRVSGYGYPTSFFLGPDKQGFYRSNHRFGWRFFPRHLARAPEPILLPPRTPRATRIYVLGESAAMGMPNPAYSFGRILEVMLRERYPGSQFEVINAAMTAINSHVILEIAGDCAAQGGDLFVIYMGNNEVVGPYGPGTVFQQAARSRALIQNAIWVKSTRTGQLLERLIASRSKPEKQPEKWQGMQMFLGNQVPLDDPRLALVYDNFERNLNDICRTAQRANAGVVLSTVAVNLANCPPFASLHRRDISPDELAKWELLYAGGAEAESHGDLKLSMERWSAASKIDDRFADLQFRMGKCLAALNQPAEAREHFQLACDLDGLRFRADSRINAAIRKAGEGSAQCVRFVDAERVFAETANTAGSLDNERFYEHVHLTFEGNYLLAKTLLDQVEAALPAEVRSRASGPVPSSKQCAERLAHTPWDEFHMVESMAKLTSMPPFTAQLGHAARQAAVDDRVKTLQRAALAPSALKEAIKIYERSLADRPDDWYLHDHFAYLAKACSAPDVAAAHWQFVLRDFPWLIDRREQLAEALLDAGQIDEAATEFRSVMEEQPANAAAHNGLGMVLLRKGNIDQSIDQLRQALKIDADNYAMRVNLGMALSEQGKLDEAVSEFQSAVKIDPDRVEARINLATICGNQGKVKEAVAQLHEVVRLQPDNVDWLSQLAFILATCPHDSIRSGSEAVKLAEKAVSLSQGQDPASLDSLAASYAELGDFAKAAQTAEQAMSLAYRQNKIALTQTLKARLDLYKAHAPLRGPR
jgi:tetratricopeptide (TPR) repeat protein